MDKQELIDKYWDELREVGHKQPETDEESEVLKAKYVLIIEFLEDLGVEMTHQKIEEKLSLDN